MQVELQYEGSRIPFHVHDRSELISDELRKGRFFEEELLRDLTLERGDHGTIVDAGAHIGNHAVFFARYLHPREVHAFEPSPENLEVLDRNLATLAHLPVVAVRHDLALGDQEQTGHMTSNPSNTGAITFRPGGGDVRMATLDAMVQQLALRDVTLLKIEVVGWELALIRGAQDLLERDRPTIVVETTTLRMLHDVLRHLEPLGYRLERSYNPSFPTLLLRAEPRAARHPGAVPEPSAAAVHGERLLVLAAAPGDEVAAFGLVRGVLRGGGEVWIALLTAGEANAAPAERGAGAPAATPIQRIAMGRQRYEESRSAARMVGLDPARVLLLGFPAGLLGDLPPGPSDPPAVDPATGATAVPYREAQVPGAPYTAREVQRQVAQLVADLHPDRIAVPAADPLDPDQQALGRLLGQALSSLGPQAPPVLVGLRGDESGPATGDIVVALDPSDLGARALARRQFASQPASGDSPALPASERYVADLQVLADSRRMG
jgi:FkbM family methyltransferase